MIDRGWLIDGKYQPIPAVACHGDLAVPVINERGDWDRYMKWTQEPGGYRFAQRFAIEQYGWIRIWENTAIVERITDSSLRDIANLYLDSEWSDIFVEEFSSRRTYRGTPTDMLDRGLEGMRYIGELSTVRGNPQGIAAMFTRSFWDWFGDSKVVDANGNPLVVYHGTPSEFSDFDLSRADNDEPGFFFSDSMEVARAFKGGSGGSIVSAFLSLQNPIVEDFNGEIYQEDVMWEMFDQAKSGGHDGFICYNITERLGDKEYTSNQYCVLSPTQVKSVHNAGTWGPGDPDIRRNPSDYTIEGPYYESSAPYGVSILDRDIWWVKISGPAGERAVGAIIRYHKRPNRYIVDGSWPVEEYSSLQRAAAKVVANLK